MTLVLDLWRYFDGEDLAIINNISTNWQDNLNRNIQNDIRRDFYSQHSLPCNFIDVSFSDESINIHLKNMQLRTPVAFESGDIKVDLLNECLQCSFKLRNLQVHANLCTHGCNLLDMSVLQESKLHLDVLDITLIGKIGLLHKLDSFMPDNYDMKLSPREIQSVLVFPASEGMGDDKTTFSADVIQTIVSMFWIRLKENVMQYFMRMIDGNVVEYSFMELFLDEPEKYIVFERERTDMANGVFDEALKKFIEMGVEPVMPALNGYFNKQGNMHHIQIQSVKFGDLNTLYRGTSASWMDDEEGATVYASMQLQCFMIEFGEYVITMQDEARNQVRGDGIKIGTDRLCINIAFRAPKGSDFSHCHMSLDLAELHVSDVQLAGNQLCPHLQDLSSQIGGYISVHIDKILQKLVQNFNTAFGIPI